MLNNFTIKKILFIIISVFLITDVFSQIIYTNISDTTIKSIINDTVDLEFDMNNDASNDFSFELADVGVVSTQVIKYIGTNPMRGVVDGPAMGEALNMMLGDTVNSNQSWDPMVSSTGLPLAVYNNGTTMSGLEWSGGIIDGYLGINFMIGTTLVYGWIRIDIPENSNEITLKDFAYESSGAYIIVGERGPCVGTNIILNALSTQESSPGANDGTASVNPSGGTTPYNYAWSNGATSSSISGLTAGSYTVAVTDSNGCFSDTTIVISTLSSIANNDVLDFSISPNPSNGKIQMSVSKRGDYTIVLRNFLGQELKKESFNDLLNKEINISDLKKGIYLISIYSKEYEKTIRVIIQ